MKNIDLRVEVSDAHVTYREIARELGITPEWLSTLMRTELSEHNRERVIKAVHKLKGEQTNDSRVCKDSTGNS